MSTASASMPSIALTLSMTSRITAPRWLRRRPAALCAAPFRDAAGRRLDPDGNGSMGDDSVQPGDTGGNPARAMAEARRTISGGAGGRKRRDGVDLAGAV